MTEKKEEEKKEEGKEKESKKEDDGVGSIKNAVKIFFLKFASMLLKLVPLIGKFLLKFLLVHILLIILWLIVASQSKDKIGTCYEADQFLSSSMSVGAYYDKTDQYRHEEFSQMLNNEEDKRIKTYKFTLSNEPITMRIKGKWVPWGGEFSEEAKQRMITDETKQLFYCALEKYELPQYLKYSQLTEKKDESIFYYISNYYEKVWAEKDVATGKTILKNIIKKPENQQMCWITRGVGLYLGVFGTDGRKQPTEYYQIIGSSMECPLKSWFNKQNFQKNPFITEGYSYDDFIKNNFSLEHFLERENKLEGLIGEDVNSARNILIDDGVKVIYNIDLHEDLLKKYNTTNVGKIIAFSMSRFNSACYFEKNNDEGNKERIFDNAYFVYGPREIRRHYLNYSEKYKYGEEIGFFILDKNYNDNMGRYYIDVLTGIEYDTSGSIQDKLKDLEFSLLGTPHPGEDNDRTDGFLAKIFNNILNSGYATLLRVVLVLFVTIYGFRMALGFGDDGKEADGKSFLSYQKLVPYLIKMAIIITITTPNGFRFYNKVFINFIVNGTIGAIDMIKSVYATSFNTEENIFFLTGGLESANQVLSLSRNFAIIDEILSMLRSEVLIFKILSLYFTRDFFFSVIGTVLVLYCMYKYIMALLSTLIPFIFLLMQWTLALPLAPFMLLFSFFKYTEKYFKNWLSFCISKAMELFVFFSAFYFWTGIINNKIKALLNFKVCVKRLIFFLFKDLSTSITTIAIPLAMTLITGLLIAFGVGNPKAALITAACMIIPFVIFLSITYEIAYFERQDTVTGLLGFGGDSFYKSYLDLNNLGGSFIFECLILLLTILMFEMMVKEVSSILAGIFVIDGSTAGTGMADGMSKFGLDTQFKEFSQTMGLAEIQKNSDTLKWSRSVVNLEKGIGENASRLGDNITKPAEISLTGVGNAGLKTIDNKIGNKIKGLEGEKLEKLPSFGENLKNEKMGSKIWSHYADSDLGRGISDTFTTLAARPASHLGLDMDTWTDKAGESIGNLLYEKESTAGKITRGEGEVFKEEEEKEDDTNKDEIKKKEIKKKNRKGLNKLFKDLSERKKKGSSHNTITRQDTEFFKKGLDKLGIKKNSGTFDKNDLEGIYEDGELYLDKHFIEGDPPHTEDINPSKSKEEKPKPQEEVERQEQPKEKEEVENPKEDEPETTSIIGGGDSTSLGGEDSTTLGGEDATSFGGENATNLTGGSSEDDKNEIKPMSKLNQQKIDAKKENDRKEKEQRQKEEIEEIEKNKKK